MEEGCTQEAGSSTETSIVANSPSESHMRAHTPAAATDLPEGLLSAKSSVSAVGGGRYSERMVVRTLARTSFGAQARNSPEE